MLSEDNFAPSLLIVGAAANSLGEAVCKAAWTSDFEFTAVGTAGINNEEYNLDVTHVNQIKEVLDSFRPDIIVCTVGENTPCAVDDQFMPVKMFDAYRINVLGPMELLRAFIQSPLLARRQGKVKKFVAISSNSARIPRRNSVAYCASKAALSMALRVAARELAGVPVQVWGYEPGLMAGTPMTQSFSDQSGSSALHRMKGVGSEGIDPQDLAQRIVNDVALFSPANNGVLFPFDAGEL